MTDLTSHTKLDGAGGSRVSSWFGSPEGWRALLLALPLILLLLLSFAAPIGILLSRAIYDSTISDNLSQTAQALRGDQGQGVPDDAVFAALANDLRHDQEQATVANLAKSLNIRLSGARSQILKTARLVSNGMTDKAAIIAAVPFWGQAETWSAIKQGLNGYTSFYLLSALDLRWTDQGITTVPPEEVVFVRVFARTFLIAGSVTLLTLAIGFPLAWMISNASARWSKLLLVLVLLPFWTSILVRTAAWTVLLQKYGLLNDLLVGLGLTNDRLELMYSRLGLIIAMTHIQLPFTLLPIYSVMRSIQPSQLRAAYSLGAPPVAAFLRVYLPQVMPGVMAGCLLTFILCLGYFITPALVGGASDQLISNFIANYVNVDLNWEMAAALSFLLLAFTLLLYLVFARFLGLDRFKLM